MTVRDYGAVFKSRWLAIVGTLLITVLAALVYSLAMTPIYRADIRFFVATPSESSGEVYEGNLASQQRVASYTRLLTGTALARRTIDALGLPMSPKELISEIRVSAASDSVVIDASVSDRSPTRARDIANELGVQFTALVSELETPPTGGRANSTASVVEEAEVPTTASEPRTLRNLLAGLGVGILAGLGVAILRDRLDDAVRDRAALEAATGTVVVGVIPHDESLETTHIISFSGSATAVAESFRQLRTNLKFVAVDNPARVLVVTSAAPGEGKSTVAINFAFALGEAGNRVVLVEGDLRRPRIASYVGAIDGVGVSSVLTQEATFDEVLQPSGQANVWIVGSGPRPPNPSELLGTQSARSLIGNLRRAFDYVVIDAPPLLPVTDALELATQSDGVLLVARHGHALRGELIRAVHNLGNVGVPLLGAVLTAVPRDQGTSIRYDYKVDPQSERPKITS